MIAELDSKIERTETKIIRWMLVAFMEKDRPAQNYKD